MTEKEIKIEQFHSVRPTKYPLVEHLEIKQELSRERLTYEMSLMLTLRSSNDSDSSRLVLSFSKVRNLKLNPENAEISFSLLLILPMNEGWEDVSFRVFNDEQNVEFSFFCDDFEANLVDSQGTIV
ncbi:MAG: hypothetical protein H0V76_08245 [Blastocatellia bacterium]|nr:hypothetical protein [Blastocatellia bacterium]